MTPLVGLVVFRPCVTIHKSCHVYYTCLGKIDIKYGIFVLEELNKQVVLERERQINQKMKQHKIIE